MTLVDRAPFSFAHCDTFIERKLSEVRLNLKSSKSRAQRREIGQGVLEVFRGEPLKLGHTFSILGGFQVRKLGPSVVSCRDITAYLHELGPPLPPGTRVASIHLNIWLPFRMQLSRGGKARYARELLGCHQLLKNEGYAHVVASGPMLQNIAADKRMTEVARYTGHAIPITVVCLGTWLSFKLARTLLLMRGRGLRHTSNFSGQLVPLWRSFRTIKLYVI